MLGEESLVKVIAGPYSGSVGYVISIKNAIFTIGLLDSLQPGINASGLVGIIDTTEEELSATSSPEAVEMYKKYQKTLSDIYNEADERERRIIAVANHLSRKYNVAPDEVHAIYKAMLCYEDYYEEHLAQKQRMR